MDGYKDFQGKTLDDAIREATAYFDVAREKLEIDIVQDAKSGVFGLIGARKAKVRARRVQLKSTVDDLVGRSRDLRVSLRDEFDSDSDDRFDGAKFGTRSDVREENQESRSDEGQRSSRRNRSERPERQDRSDRQARQDNQPRVERFGQNQLDERGEQESADERRLEDDDRRSNEGRRSTSRRQRGERSTSERQECSERQERGERNQDRSRRNRPERNQERPNQERAQQGRQDSTQARQNVMQSEGDLEPMYDENGALIDAESRERSSRRRRRGRGRGRSRSETTGADGNALDANLEAGENQDALDYADAPVSEIEADFDAARDADGRNQESRRNGRRDSQRDGQRDGRRDNNNRRNNRRDSEGRRDNDGRRGERRSGNDRNERPYGNAENQSKTRDFDAENDFAQANQLMDDQAYDRPEGLPDIPLESLDQDLVRSVALEVTERLVFPIIGSAALTVEATDGRVKVGVDCGDNSGLLIGREGQTLASIQYLASRIIARKLGAAVRVQLDTGDYRERQDEKLRELALSFAERVRATGRPQSTRPLSSYHRRVVHLVLQDDEEIVTRSKGEGPLKRVIILRRRKNSAD